MGLFNRKASKASVHNDEKAGQLYTNTDRTSTTLSLKSPGLSNGLSKMTEMPMPDVPLPKAPDPAVDPAAYLRSIHSVRQRSAIILKRAKVNKLNHFDVDPSRFSETADYVVSIIKRDFAPDYRSIPPHGRWQHFDVGGRPRVNQLLQSWPSSIDAQERTRRLIDLFLVSVLLDAGAGTKWCYKSKESGKVYRRSEGLAVASLEMFKSGMFSSDTTEPCQVDGAGLKTVTAETLAKGMQVTPENPLPGLEGRAGLLARLSKALNNQELFGVDARPGNMLGMLEPFRIAI
ncbi:MAG: hypothetical protein Q9160_001846 [Pyrenula sp. 1 TL-2023]